MCEGVQRGDGGTLCVGGSVAMASIAPQASSSVREWNEVKSLSCGVGPVSSRSTSPRWVLAVPHPSSAELSTKACADRKGGACPLLHGASVRGVSKFLQLALQSVFQARLALNLSNSRAV